MALRIALLLAVLLIASCATVPPAPAPGTGTVYGTVRLVPRQGVTPSPGGGASSYSDPRLRDVRLVDYSRPGFVVVYADAPERAPTVLSLAIREGRLGPHIDPQRAALGAGGVLRVANETSQARVVSLPEAGVLERLEPGATLELALEDSRAHAVHLLGSPHASAEVFVAPGRYAVASPAGRWSLRDLPPGPVTLHTWHPRFPPTVRETQVPSDQLLELDLEIGVDVGDRQP